MKLVGHRGAIINGVTENTISAFRLAKESGMDAIEMDLRLTKDGKIVIHHDPNLKRVYGMEIVIAEHTLEELTGATSKFDHPVVSFEEAISFIKDFPCVLELKSTGVGSKLHEYIIPQKHSILAVISFHTNYLEEYKNSGGRCPIGFLPTKKNFIISPLIAKTLGADILGTNIMSRYLPFIFKIARFMKLQLYVYPINSKKMNKLFRYKYRFDFLVGDDPLKLKKFNS